MTWKERFIWIALIVGVILYFTQCNQKTCPVIKEITYDTTIIKGKDSIAWRTPAVKTITRFRDTGSAPATVSDYAINDPVPDNGDTAAIVDDWLAARYYEDTARFQNGDVVTLDSVNRNRLTAHRVFLFPNIPVVTKTVSYMQPKRSQLYFGANFGYNNVGANISFKDTSDRVFEAGTVYIGKFYYYVGRKWLIKLKK